MTTVCAQSDDGSAGAVAMPDRTAEAVAPAYGPGHGQVRTDLVPGLLDGGGEHRVGAHLDERAVSL
ncbi:hypothetical protein ACFWNT_47145, partial [Streptomyces sp. NPDC058409]|uniref:hypothetical protein n=1 Tax=Streptomyces sp. NPDC058409 TaxID=3346484 RepID=UPI00365FC08D